MSLDDSKTPMGDVPQDEGRGQGPVPPVPTGSTGSQGVTPAGETRQVPVGPSTQRLGVPSGARSMDSSAEEAIRSLRDGNTEIQAAVGSIPLHGAGRPHTDPEPAPRHEAAVGQTAVRATVPSQGTPAGAGTSQAASVNSEPTQGASGGAVPPQAPVPGRPQASGPKGDGGPSKAPKAKGSHPFLAGLGGGLVGCAVVAALGFGLAPLVSTHGGATQVTTTSGAGQTVDITANDVDATTAEIVAAKCLPSLASISVSTSEGEGVGSGVVLDTDGNIITNYHVVEGASDIVVTIDNQSYNATVVGTDESSDLAVVKVDLEGASVTPMAVGDSSKLVVGEWVMALGSPFGLDQSVSTGIVSSLYRSTMLEGTSGNTIYTNLIQTDTAINPGNSGGALVNDNGELVGINSIIESASGSSSGVGFAIPSNYAVKVAQTIISGKTVEHAYLGANVRSVTPATAKGAHLGVSQGAMVASVVKDGPAAQAGLQEGDIITKLGDEEVSSADALILAVRSHEVGDKVTLTYYRGTEEKTVEVTLGSDAQAQSTDSRQSSFGSGTDGSQDGSDRSGSNLWDRQR